MFSTVRCRKSWDASINPNSKTTTHPRSARSWASEVTLSKDEHSWRVKLPTDWHAQYSFCFIMRNFHTWHVYIDDGNEGNHSQRLSHPQLKQRSPLPPPPRYIFLGQGEFVKTEQSIESMSIENAYIANSTSFSPLTCFRSGCSRLLCLFFWFVWSYILFGSWLVPLRQYSLPKIPSFYSLTPQPVWLWPLLFCLDGRCCSEWEHLHRPKRRSL